MQCKICHGPTRYVFEKSGFPIHECAGCRHRMTYPHKAETHVSEVYSDSYFKGGGAGYPDYLLEKSMLTRHGCFYSRLAQKILSRTGSVIDVGAAAGFILIGFSENGWVCTGVEPNESMARHARDKLGLDVRTETVERFTTDKKVDCVVLIQVIAHLIDPASVIDNLRKFLKTGAVVLVETWDYQSVTAKIFDRHWHEYSPPSVLHWFSQKSCDLLFDKKGFAKIASGRPPKKIVAAHAIALTNFKTGNKYFSKILDIIGWIIPKGFEIPYPFDDVFWTIYRSNE